MNLDWLVPHLTALKLNIVFMGWSQGVSLPKDLQFRSYLGVRFYLRGAAGRLPQGLISLVSLEASSCLIRDACKNYGGYPQ